MIKGTSIITINCAPSIVYAAISDVTLMGEFSPECTGGRWLSPATGPAIGAKFEGDNIAKLGPLTVKKWTTVSTVTACVPDELFEFSSDDITFWRYELIEIDGSTRVTETFRYEPFTGFQKFLYDTVLNRQQSLVDGMTETLEQLKSALEGDRAAA